jgi:hypothetical protein
LYFIPLQKADEIRVYFAGKINQNTSIKAGGEENGYFYIPEPGLENPDAVATYHCNQRNTVFNLSPVFESVHQPVLKASATSKH